MQKDGFAGERPYVRADSNQCGLNDSKARLFGELSLDGLPWWFAELDSAAG